MKIFVTGATGFIGKQLVRALAEKNHELYCMDRRKKCMELQKQYGGKAFVGDITKKEALRESMKECDQVVHLASNASFWEPTKQAYTEVNVWGTRNVMEVALELGISRVIHVSSALVYGNTPHSPFREESPIGSIRYSEYARTKYQGELLAWNCHKKGLPLVVLYPGAVIGPGDHRGAGRYIYDIVDGKLPALALQKSVVTLVYVEDVLEAIIRALEAEDISGQRYLVGNHRMTIGEFVTMISRISGVKLPRLSIPDPVVLGAAALLTKLSYITRRPPPWGMSWDWVRSIHKGMVFDGSKIVSDLGVNYTPIDTALKEVIAQYQDEVEE